MRSRPVGTSIRESETDLHRSNATSPVTRLKLFAAARMTSALIGSNSSPIALATARTDEKTSAMSTMGATRSVAREADTTTEISGADRELSERERISGTAPLNSAPKTNGTAIGERHAAAETAPAFATNVSRNSLQNLACRCSGVRPARFGIAAWRIAWFVSPEADPTTDNATKYRPSCSEGQIDVNSIWSRCCVAAKAIVEKCNRGARWATLRATSRSIGLRAWARNRQVRIRRTGMREIRNRRIACGGPSGRAAAHVATRSRNTSGETSRSRFNLRKASPAVSIEENARSARSESATRETKAAEVCIDIPSME